MKNTSILLLVIIFIVSTQINADEKGAVNKLNQEDILKLNKEEFQKLLSELKTEEPPEEKDLGKDELPFPFIQVSGDKVLEELHKLRKANKDKTPVILGSPDEVRKYLYFGEKDTRTVQSILQKAEKIDVNKWFEERKAKDKNYYTPPKGEWPVEESFPMEIQGHKDILSNKPKDKVIIGIIPTGNSWEIFAHLKWGGWNDCPMPEEHVAIFKYWFQKYKASPVSVVGDIVEAVVEKAPETKDQALNIANEQFIYDTDIVYQGTLSVEKLGKGLLNSNVWYFWWD